MNKYTIPCTEEQTKKAFELGAPLLRLYGTGCSDYIDMLIISDTEAYTIPTAEEMIGWLEEQKISMEIVRVFGKYAFRLLFIHDSGERNLHIEEQGFLSRKEATLAAIDSALEYLLSQKH